MISWIFRFFTAFRVKNLTFFFEKISKTQIPQLKFWENERARAKNFFIKIGFFIQKLPPVNFMGRRSIGKKLFKSACFLHFLVVTLVWSLYWEFSNREIGKEWGGGISNRSDPKSLLELFSNSESGLGNRTRGDLWMNRNLTQVFLILWDFSIAEN